jgi:oligoendopeptidase F
MASLSSSIPEWEDYAPLFASLEETELSPTSLYTWLETWSDLERRIRGIETQLRNATNADLTDERARRAFEAYATKLKPAAQAAANRLKMKYLTAGLHPPELEEMTRTFEAEAKLFDADNAALLAEDDMRAIVFNRRLSATTVVLDAPVPYGETLAMLSDPIRAVRERVWRARLDAVAPLRSEFDTLFLELVARRHRIAHTAGFANYRDYRWLEYGRFDYQPEDTRSFATGVEHSVLPLLKRLRERRRTLLGVAQLRPWDLQVYPFDKPLISPFGDAEGVLAAAETLVTHIDAEMLSLLRQMRGGGTIDMTMRPNKALTDFADYDYLSELPTIFTYTTGDVQDLKYFIHEFGHCFHYYLTMTQPLYWQQWGRLEVMELAAQATELLSWPHLGEVFPQEEIERLTFLAAERILADLALVPILSQLQDWIYLEKLDDLTPAAISQAYLHLARRFEPEVDWTDLDHYRRHGWQSRHLYQWPFYYIEYGLAWIGALDIYGQYLRAPTHALLRLKTALKLGSSRPVSEIYRQAGSTFPPRPEDVARAVNILADALEPILEP